jgi:hypothetical protein
LGIAEYDAPYVTVYSESFGWHGAGGTATGGSDYSSESAPDPGERAERTLLVGVELRQGEQALIPPATPKHQAELEKLVERIMSAKQTDPAADVTALEREIDERVYKLYGLTAEEIRIVEGLA